ncbi:MAG: 1-acyl-sn-glycerol-3-phosphate acyltransferase [Cyclobacteriaceae bacterium]
MFKLNGHSRKYPPILPGTKEWPVVQMAKDRKSFVREVKEATIKSLERHTNGKGLIDVLEAAIYKERLRIKQNPWKVDPSDEASFFKDIQQKLIDYPSSDDPKHRKIHEDILDAIINRYSDEIAGNFNRSSYRFARGIATMLFARLLNAARIKGPMSLFSRQLDLDDQIHMLGEPEHLRKLAKKGTVILVPTHFSNLDSILIGWVIQWLGLPPFIYGAGLNLFNIKIFAYFMNSLGAYKVDRRKKNLLYLETLKSYSTLALKRGCHSLFFPGGTRSRSGKLEERLKLGLLGTAVEAQRYNYQQSPAGEAQKIFVVPVVINYHFVLEAPTLINDYLKAEGQERYYIENDEYSTSFKIAKFLIEFFTRGSDISVTIGRGMDILGNYVDDDGVSIDHAGNEVDVKDYFISEGKVTEDGQREQQYTRMLANRIVEEYHKNNCVFASHLTAFLAFEMIKKANEKLDLFELLRLPEEDIVIPYDRFKKNFKRLRKRIYKMNEKGKIKYAEHLSGKTDFVINFGIKNVGTYHTHKPLGKNKSGNIVTHDLNKLYYYHNRLEGYDLDKYIK